MKTEATATVGLSFGNVIAIILSWTTNHSIAWAILHGFLGWFYILYYVITKR